MGLNALQLMNFYCKFMTQFVAQIIDPSRSMVRWFDISQRKDMDSQAQIAEIMLIADMQVLTSSI